MPSGEELERLYGVFPWPEDLDSPAGRERLERAVEAFRRVVRHPWVGELVGGGELSVVDVCGGTGIGGIALARALGELGASVSLTVCDLRREALERARRHGREALGVEVGVLRWDATRLHEAGVRADIALLYGLSTPHFSPYDMVRLMASLARVLEPGGLLMVEESDRTYSLVVERGYRDVVPEYAGEERVVLTLHSGYDALRGVVRRVAVELPSMRMAGMEVRFWDIASTAALAWAFFGDVDFVALGGRRGVLLAREPRGIDPAGYSGYPSLLGEE